MSSLNLLPYSFDTLVHALSSQRESPLPFFCATILHTDTANESVTWCRGQNEALEVMFTTGSCTFIFLRFLGHNV